MTEYRLTYDTARCHGNGRDECETCLRKLAPGNPERQVYMSSWALDTPCESRIPIQDAEKIAALTAENKALRAALAEPVEPVAWQSRILLGGKWGRWQACDPPDDLNEREVLLAGKVAYQIRPLYTAPPRCPAEPLTGWRFQRNADGSVGIFAPPPKPGESQRTSDVVYPSNNRDLHELLGKLADHMAAHGIGSKT